MDEIDIDDITVSDFTRDDVAGVLDYWYRSPRAYLKALGVLPEALPAEAVMGEMLELNIEQSRVAGSSCQAIVTIRRCGKAIGIHELTHLTPRVSGIMHAHIWNAADRGQGFGLVSYVKALDVFFSRFSLEKILFETPVTNIGAQKVKLQLGIAPCGRGTITLPILPRPLETISYRVLRSELPRLHENMRAGWYARRARTVPATGDYV